MCRRKGLGNSFNDFREHRCVRFLDLGSLRVFHYGFPMGDREHRIFYSSENFVSVLELIQRQESKLCFRGLILPCRGDERRGGSGTSGSFSPLLVVYYAVPLALRTESIIQVEPFMAREIRRDL
ncbi:hypothetical protein CEXT_419931 [Caerostris extrusa]|uniref:Maturase K n=1 Tax=Caerostris extrusa TaxID=172846 RepID=A0AAV4SLJ1_CAEEX|nr:hypothetical protein CEXT_419931 [Caerostris extrusa]